MADNPLGGMFAAPQRKPSTVQRIGNALAGFGAGVQGRGMEFIANQREQEQALSQERTQAMIQDALAVDNLLANSQVEPAMNLMNQRLNLISELGGDPSDTAEVMQLVAAGRVNEARELIGGFLGQAESMGLFQRPKPEMINASQLTDSGQAIFRDPSGRVSAQNVEGFASPAERPTEAVRTLMARAEAAGLQEGSPEYRAFMAQGGASRGEGEAAREREISDLMQTFGMDRQSAIRSLSERTFVDPTTGNLIAYDPMSGTGRLPDLDIPGQTSSVQPPERRVTEEDLAFDPGKGTGFASSFLGAWNSTIGQLPFVPISTERAQAAQNLRILERDAINALATSSRPAVVEQQRIIQALPRAMEWFENPDDARMKMTSFIDLMTNQYVDDTRYASNLKNPRTLREESARRASEVERIMSRVLTPEASREMMQSINRVERATESIRSIPDAQLQSIDPSQLNDMELDVYIERLRNAGQ